MCGILGFTGQPKEGQWTETYRLLEVLFLASQQRGWDATGFVVRTEPFKHPKAGETVMDKMPVTAQQFVDHNVTWRSLRHQRCTTVLGHVRLATHGSPVDNRHNHPLVGHSSLYLAHNGILMNHRETAQRHRLRLSTAVDSELILRFVESAKHPAMGLDHALRNVEGSMTAVVYDGHRDTLYMARDEGRPLWLLRLANDKRWFFASTREILADAFAAVVGDSWMSKVELLMPLASGGVHLLKNSGQFLGLPHGMEG